MGQDAVSAIIPSFIAPLDVRNPIDIVQKSVSELRDQVDIIVLLTHQGKTAPMQTDAESDPRLQRDIDVDIALAGAVDSIDVLLAGHADAGTPEVVVNEKTGTLIMQTYGQATHLGFLQLTLDGRTGEIIEYDGKLIPVDSNRWPPDPDVAAKLQKYRAAYPELLEVVGELSARMNRLYIEESDVGNLFADAFVEASGADIGFVHSGSLRKDLPGGDVRLVDLLDTYPFVDDVIIKEMSGDQRIVSLEHNGKTVAPDDMFTVAAPGFLAEGGDLYGSFAESVALRDVGQVSDVMIEYIRMHEVVAVPQRGRQEDVSQRP
jgi:2',3'-cyclic-nucleotide 2'-phosphodiesterase (5'-nucleotidase family)